MITNCRLWHLHAGTDLPTPVEVLPGLSLNQLSERLPQGAYSTLRTYPGNRIVRLEDHFDRLAGSAELASCPIRLSEDRLRCALRTILEAQPAQDYRVRISLELTVNPGDIFISLEKLVTPASEAYRDGIVVKTLEMHRDNPKAKLTTFITVADQARQELPPEFNEAVMVSPDGFLLEGLTSNFFSVLDNVIWTAEAGVLNGLTRKLLLEEIRSMGLPLRMDAVPRNCIPQIQEAWISSATRGVLPVVKIDQAVIGAGKPGPITRSLMDRYQQRITFEAQPV